jgi:hypothetical protein
MRAAQKELRGIDDGFVAALALSLAGPQSLVYASYIGGSDRESTGGIALDALGNVHVVGTTWSADFPVSSGALQTALRGASDAFVARMSASGTLTYSTYLGGGDGEHGYAVDVDSRGKQVGRTPMTSREHPTHGREHFPEGQRHS